MSLTSHGPERSQDLIEIISGEIQTARDQTRPTSRQELANIVHARTGMSVGEALEFVDSYCDENAPGVPGYLQEEFAIPYLKVLAVFFTAISLFICYHGVRLYQDRKPGWVWLCIGVVLFGLGALSWVKSIEREVERSRKGR